MNKKLKAFGLVGHPVTHSLSPAMHNSAFRSLGLNAVYLLFDLNPAQMRSIFQKKRHLILDGFNVTIPYKELAYRVCDRVVGGARVMGAVNTVKVVKGKLIGYNTDIDGLLESFKKARYSLRSKRVLLFGAGGGGRAVVYAALKSGAECVRIVEVDLKRARALKRDFKRHFRNANVEALPYRRKVIRSVLGETDCIINATGIGLKPGDRSIISPSDLKVCRGLFAYDLIYNPALPPFLKVVKRRGFKTLNGLDMLLYQGAKAFHIWTGKKPPIEVMKKAVQNAI